MKVTTVVLVLFVGLTAGYSFSQWILLEHVHQDPPTSKNFSVIPALPLSKELLNPVPQHSKPLSSRVVELLSQIPSEEVAVKGVLRGKVVQQNGAALSGVKLSLSASGTAPGFGGIQVHQDSLLEFVEHRARRYRFQHAAQQQSQSRSDGSFEFSNLPDARFKLDVKLAGYSFEVRSLDPENPDIIPGAQLLIVASSVCRLTVDVRLPDGTQASSAELKGEDGWTTAWSSKAPSVEIEAGYHLLSAQVGTAYSCELQAVHVSNQKKNQSVVFQMISDPKISIKVIAPTMLEDFSFLVYWLAADPGTSPIETQLLELGQPIEIRFWQSKPASVLTPALTNGRYSVGVGFVPWRLEQLQSVHLSQGVENLEFHLDHVPKELYLQIQVVGYAGEGMDNLLLNIEDSSGHRIGCKKIARGRGYYWLLPDIDPETILKGIDDESYYLSVYASELGNKLVPLDSREIYVSYAESVELQIEVLGLAKEGPYTLTLQPSGGEPIYAQWHEDGYFLVKTESGPYHLKLLNSSRVIADEEVVLSSGTKRIQLSMPAVFSLQVEYSGDEDYLRLFSPFGEGPFDIGREIINGQVEFTELVSGKYFIQAGSEQMAVEVVGNTHVKFVPKLVNALGVSILFPKGHRAGVHESGFRNGDLIVGLDNQLFSSLEEMKRRFKYAGSFEKMVFMVDRAGETFELTIDSALLRKIGQEQDYFRFFETTR